MREGKSAEHKEEEERTFVPRAVSVPPKPLFCCDKQCSEKTISCWQLASVVANESDEAHTTNLCQKCSNKHLQAKGEEPLTNVKVEAVCGKEGASEKNVENDGERTISAWDVGTKFRKVADEEKQAGIQGQWQQGIASQRTLGASEMLP